VRELRLEPSHWYFWKSEGTRVYGNWCHWIDVATWLVPAQPMEISLQPSAAADSVGVRFADGSLLQLVIGTAGDGFRGVQETIDIRAGDTTIFIDDFKRMTVLDRGRTRVQRAWVRDRGHTTMYREFEDAVLASGRPQYSSRDLLRTMTLTEQIRALLVSGERQRVLAPDTQGT
jgi:predicted dehydrogenase